MTPISSVLVVGAGLAGARCAETLRAEGYDGSLTVVGDEAAAPYERPALSKEFLAGTRGAETLPLRPAAFWPEHDIELVLGTRVVGVDRRDRVALTDRGTTLSWDVLVVATGARPRLLPIGTPPGVHVLRTLDDARRLRDGLAAAGRLAVVGGGFVGAEVASTATSLGLDVTMLETAPQPFGTLLGPEVGGLLADRYRAAGVDVRTGAHASAFRTCGDGRVGAVLLADGTEIGCDVVLVAVGVQPAAELLPSEPDRGVFACGDVTGGGHWTSAAAEATGAARAILGLDSPPRQPAFVWSDQFGLRLQLVGDPRGAARVELDGGGEGFVARYLGADGRLVAALAANRPQEVGSFRRELALAA